MHSDYHGILNVGTGKAYSFNEVIEILNRKLGSDRMPEYMANPISNYVSHTLADTSKAEKEIGFRAQISLEAGIDAIINSYSPTTDPNIS
jgi:UDP-glucose 4-epimerase